MSAEYYIPNFGHRKQVSSLCHIKMGGRGRKMFKFDKESGLPVQVGVILGLGFSAYWLEKMYMM